MGSERRNRRRVFAMNRRIPWARRTERLGTVSSKSTFRWDEMKENQGMRLFVLDAVLLEGGPLSDWRVLAAD